MFNDYRLIDSTNHDKNEVIEYYHPELTDITYLESKALDLLTDFHTSAPITVNQTDLTANALQIMVKNKVRCLLVVNDSDLVVGTIGAKSLQGIQLTQVAQENGISIKEVIVSMLMDSLDKIETIDYSILDNARVGHIARFLHEKNIDHVLVTEKNSKDKNIIRGIFSASFIARRLGMQIGYDYAQSGVSEIGKAIHNL